MLQIKNISFAYDKETTLQNIEFSLNKGQSLAVIGESGCGKSTLLKVIYGLHDLNEGQIFWNDSEVLGPKYHLIPGMDFMKYLAQDFDLMPFITVAENVGKYLSNSYKDKKEDRIAELLEVVEMSEFATVKAKYLSGGQMQRVAIARVLALEPEVLLLDEPFSHIDNFRKNALRRKLFQYFKEKKITTIIATHDSAEVLSFADEVLIMQKGTVIESGAPTIVYTHPKSKYVASLFGEVNEISGSFFDVRNTENLLLFPHQLKVVDNSKLKVTVITSYFRGSYYLIEASYTNGFIFFESKDELEKSALLYLDILKV